MNNSPKKRTQPWTTTLHPARLDVEVLLKQCQINRLRRSGPGGQHRNKVETAVQIIFQPTGTIAEANEKRSQAANQKEAIFRLRVKLALELRTSGEFVPGEIWKGRCKNKRISVNPRHDDFPILLADGLDLLEVFNWDVAAAAEKLGVSSTQLVKLLAIEPAGLMQLNTHRAKQNKNPLRG